MVRPFLAALRLVVERKIGTIELAIDPSILVFSYCSRTSREAAKNPTTFLKIASIKSASTDSIQYPTAPTRNIQFPRQVFWLLDLLDLALVTFLGRLGVPCWLLDIRNPSSVLDKLLREQRRACRASCPAKLHCSEDGSSAGAKTGRGTLSDSRKGACRGVASQKRRLAVAGE